MKSSKSNLPQKLLAMALSLALAVTWLIPSSVTSYAAEGEGSETQVTTELPEAVDGTITLTGDVELAETAVITSDTTLDLAGHTVKGYKGSNGGRAIRIDSGKLTVTDSSEGKTGSIVLPENSGGIAIIVNGGSLDMQAGDITVSGEEACGIQLQASGSAVMNGGSVKASGDSAMGIAVFGTDAKNPSTFTLQSGSIDVDGNNLYGGIYISGNMQNINIDGGSITVKGNMSYGIQAIGTDESGVPYDYSGHNINVTGGKIIAEGNRSDAIYLDGMHFINVEGGSIESKHDTAILYRQGNNTGFITGGTVTGKTYGVYIMNAATGKLTISKAPVISGETASIYAGGDRNKKSASVQISSGYFNGKIADGVPGDTTYKYSDYDITGGYFTDEIEDSALYNFANAKGHTPETYTDEVKASETNKLVAVSKIRNGVEYKYQVKAAKEKVAYVLMNIPYGKFYEAEGVSGVDAVTSATVKTYNQNMAGGSYHDGYIHESAEGAEILGITYPVYVEDTAALDGLTEVMPYDSDTITVAAGKSALTTKEVSGTDLLFASGDYAYCVMDSEPANYKTLSVGEDGSFSFSAVKNAAAEKTGATASLTYGGHYTDITLSFKADEIDDSAVVSGIIVTAGGSKYALRHVEDVWRKTELGWNWNSLDGTGLSGKTITNITYYLQDGGIYSYDVNVAVKKNPGKIATAEFEDANIVAITGLPEDIENAKATVATKVGRGQTPVVIADNVAVTDNKVTLATEAQRKTAYNVSVVSDNYADITVETTYDPEKKAEDAKAEAIEKADEAAKAKDAAAAAKKKADEAAKNPGPEAVAAANEYQAAAKTLSEAAAAAKEAADKALEAAKKAYAEGSDEVNAAQKAADDAASVQTEAEEAVKDAGTAATAAQKAAEEKAAAAKKAAEIKANNGTLDKNMPKVSIKGPKKAKKSFTAKWKKLSKKNRKAVKGIEVEYALNKNFTKSVKFKKAGKTKTSVKINKLQSKKTYYVRVHTYKVVKGVKYVSPWSAVKKVKVK